MQKAFVRALWGNFLGDDKTNPRPSKMLKDINRVLSLPERLKIPFVTYTFGANNHAFLLKIGVDSVLVDKNSSVWDMKTELYRHKLEILKVAMDSYTEIIYLDWDCIPTQPIPEDLWNKMNKKASFQANLFQYRTKKCLWREIDQRKVTNGGFIYLRDKSIPHAFIQNWNYFKEWTNRKYLERSKRGLDLRFREKCLIFDDEPSMSKYIDDVNEKWPGTDYYYNNYEPDCCSLGKKSVYGNVNTKKYICFTHLL